MVGTLSIKSSAMAIVLGMAILLVSQFVVGQIETSVVGQGIYNERLGNMTANWTTFNTVHDISDRNDYVTLQILNVSNSTDPAGGTVLSVCGTANCYAAIVFGNNTVGINGSRNNSHLGNFSATDVIWINYSTASGFDSTTTMATVQGIATTMRAGMTLVGIILLIIGAASIIKLLGAWDY